MTFSFVNPCENATSGGSLQGLAPAWRKMAAGRRLLSCTRPAWRADCGRMIDTTVILFSTVMCLVVIFRAIRLDGQRPWFGSAAEDRKAGGIAREGETDSS